jgi:hypothetical protein
MQRVILFNGPPSSGKDTAALACFDVSKWTPPYPYLVFDRMSMPNKKAFAGTVSYPVEKHSHVSGFEERKEDPIPIFGVSYRQWQIDFSEKFMKPLYGEDIFGKLFIDRSSRQSKDAIFLVPDCGFDIEHYTLAEHFGRDNVFVMKLYRPGYGFKNDSRSYLSVGGNFVKDVLDNVRHITNNGTKDEFEQKVLRVVKEWLNAST